jgi:hypothetical protein
MEADIKVGDSQLYKKTPEMRWWIGLVIYGASRLGQKTLYYLKISMHEFAFCYLSDLLVLISSSK